MKIIQALNYDEKEKSLKEFYVNSCGIIKEIDIDTGVQRINGREDYQLVFIKKGPFYVRFTEDWQIITDNTIILFKPGERQEYKCLKNEGAEYLWVHFNGKMAYEILKSSKIYDQSYFDADIAPVYEKTINRIILEITRKSSGYEIKVLSLFTELICEIIKSTGRENSDVFNQLKPALDDMERESQSKNTVSDYARMCNLSEFYFIHKFKEVTGKSPMQYKNEILMKQAAYLLENTNLPVNKVSEKLGIEDSMYFCKKFKAFYGVAPSIFKKKI